MNIKELFNKDEPIGIEKYLTKCGVENVNEYLYCDVDNTLEDCDKYDDMNKAIDCLNKGISNSEEPLVYLVQDSDSDGVTSCTIAYLFLKQVCHVNSDNIIVLFHTNKQHGLTKEIYSQINGSNGLVWLPDAGTNDVAQCKALNERGFNILITDHHQSNADNPYAVIINNQMSAKVKNKDLAGVGVTLKFTQYYCNKNNIINFSDNLYDLVALGNISDVMNMRSIENHIINIIGLNEIQNPFLKILCNKHCKHNPPTPKDIAWNVTPLINSVCRSNKLELKKSMFRCFVDEYTMAGMKDTMKQMEAQHRKQVNDSKAIYEDIVKMVAPNNNKVMLIKTINTPYTGLVANKLLDYYKKPILLTHYNDNTNEYIGSCRANTDMLTPLHESGLMTICAGHNEAFGVGFKDYNVEKLYDFCNKLDIEEKQIEVAKSFHANKIPKNLFGAFDEYDYLWGTGVPEINFYIHDISIKSSNIQVIGKNFTTIKFKYKGVEYIKFYMSHDEQKQQLHIDENKQLNLNVVGKLSVNEWQGKITPQVVINQYECQIVPKKTNNIDDIF